MLARRIEEVRQATVYGVRKQWIFREAATRYLEENMHLATIANCALYLKQLDPYIGHLPLQQVHMGSLQPFINDRRKLGRKNKSINLALSIARRVLNLSARLWRDENGLTFLETAPLIQMLPLTDARKPYPLSWDEQNRLFRQLPDHLSQMCLFKVNTGCREQEVCQLRWEWEIPVPELNTSVFLIPDKLVKNREDRLVILNKVAASVVNSLRGMHSEYVFTYKGHSVTSINNSAWKRVRKAEGIPARVHDLKHTFGRRLRAAGVPLETRKILLGHRNGDITSHYSAPELEELIEAANRVCEGKSGKTPALVILKQRIA
ncbi:tyrosine-type recombinase/integrase [Oceanicoccus sp. KOV_DT_Chl]|uniref:tyrosine-type recombinase/integrase n=1 Tax=Oceanicoccus sp. KOV_DT_Chl TaxID=1904639 RepID=UPI001F41FBED|nr:tyrosine-type recombinase/integrase [Oceanicoccus sp. KOV_DT_Chl]